MKIFDKMWENSGLYATMKYYLVALTSDQG